MRKQSTVLTVLSFIVLLTTSSLTIYYRNQALSFQQQYNVANERLKGVPFVPRVEVERQVSVSQLVVPFSNNREPAPQVVGTGSLQLIEGVTPPPRDPEPDRGRRRPSDWMDNLRTNDPQRYAEFQQRRLELQQRMQNAWTQSADYFMSRDTSRMTPSDLVEYNTMTMLLSQAASLNQQLQSGLPPDERQQVMAALRSNIVAVVPLLENERNREYYDAAVAMGQSEQDAATLVAYINQIASNTTLRTILPGVRMGGWARR